VTLAVIFKAHTNIVAYICLVFGVKLRNLFGMPDQQILVTPTFY